MEYVGLVRKQHDRRIVRHTRQRAVEIVLATEAVAAERVGELVAEADEPKWLAVPGQAKGVVFQHGSVHVLQRPANAVGAVALHARQGAVPPVVIAKDGVDAEWRFQHR